MDDIELMNQIGFLILKSKLFQRLQHNEPYKLSINIKRNKNILLDMDMTNFNLDKLQSFIKNDNNNKIS